MEPGACSHAGTHRTHAHTRAIFHTYRSALRPHILLWVTDDQGWGNVGYHNPIVQTPHMDKLSSEGIRLDRHYTVKREGGGGRNPGGLAKANVLVARARARGWGAEGA